MCSFTFFDVVCEFYKKSQENSCAEVLFLHRCVEKTDIEKRGFTDGDAGETHSSKKDGTMTVVWV
jgi:hypothetical protein